jgi:hypothetical protein
VAESGDGAAGAGELYDPATGKFATTGEMLGRCTADTRATLLRDGRVLITGTADPGGAESYDPATGTFDAVGSMVDFHQTATLLPDGRVLVLGGFNDSAGGFLASAEVYVPATGKFAATGSMKTPREGAQAIVLSDGRVLVVGGDQGDAGIGQLMLTSAEIYDPVSGKFTSTGSMTEARTHFTATRLLDGRVLVAGGYNTTSESGSTASAEIYDPSSGTFGPTGPMAVNRSDQTATLLKDGRVLVAGGGGGTDETYDPATGSFASKGSMVKPYGDIAVLLADGRVFFPGQPSALYWP